MGLMRARAPFAAGRVAFGGISGTYATLIGPVSDVRHIIITNTLDNEVIISLDGGTTAYLYIPGSILLASKEYVISLPPDLAYNGTISVKHNGAAPTAGVIAAGVITGI